MIGVFCACDRITDNNSFLWTVFALRIATGFFTGFAMSASSSIIAREFGDEREEQLTKLIQADVIGIFVGAVLCITLIASFNVIGILQIVAIIMFLFGMYV